ncbi:MAG: DeoR/GlpR family DNA-binding transcription regulator [Acidobacteria bacterium]|nr:DeoR/GlpR family DNA-binding transcription regulator [Acidobacteriota bacterium]
MEPPRTTRLLTEDRRRRVVDKVQQSGSATVEELSKLFGVSAVTIRSDLAALEEIRALVRSHGGAVRPIEMVEDYPLRLKETVHQNEKRRIGQKAAELVRPGQTIVLDAGTTTVQLARSLKTQSLNPLTVITNALNVANELVDMPDLTLIMVGGLLRPFSRSFVGPQAEHMLLGLHADQFFLAVDGIDPAEGIFTPGLLEVELKSLMLRISTKVTVVADGSKFGRRSLCRISAIDRIDRLVTDSHAPEAMVEELRHRGIEVLIA